MPKKKNTKKRKMRTENRILADDFSSVEFKPSGLSITYQFKLRDISPRGVGILVNETSKVIETTHVGDVLDMNYYPKKEMKLPVLMKTEVKHITRHQEGRYKGNYVMGLYVLEL